ncbi:MAG TPA: Holliday junction branch migration protein RuvA [Mycobacteriales bacterium]|nr:Holliday junction branch migration protein RuvA [Mycobacteriales bacterium]
MIASVEGTVSALLPDGVVLTLGGTGGAVGFAVQTTPGTRAALRIGDAARLMTSMVVREDSLTLYGFADDDERALFDLLQTATGVGPRLAQAVLTVHQPDVVRRALQDEDLATLTLVPGIGRKGAQRLVLELKDKVAAGPVTVAASPGQGGWRATVTSALVGLGWTPAQADEAVGRAAVGHREATGAEVTEADVPALLRAALTALGQGR